MGEQVPVAVPEVVHVGEPAEAYPYQWAIMRWLDGVDAWEARHRENWFGGVLGRDLAAVVRHLRRMAVADAPPREPMWRPPLRPLTAGTLVAGARRWSDRRLCGDAVMGGMPGGRRGRRGACSGARGPDPGQPAPRRRPSDRRHRLGRPRSLRPRPGPGPSAVGARRRRRPPRCGRRSTSTSQAGYGPAASPSSMPWAESSTTRRVATRWATSCSAPWIDFCR